MSFVDTVLSQGRPSSIRDVSLPRRVQYYPSPTDWRDIALYFLLVDRFSDDVDRPPLDRNHIDAARPTLSNGQPWRWDRWAESGRYRWQGGTLKGIQRRLEYLKELGISAIWLSPIFKQRTHLDTYHGYGIQDFLEVDPHLGTRRDLVNLVQAAHQMGIYIILDIIFNHSGNNWLYPPDTPGGSNTPYFTEGRYRFGAWRDSKGQPVPQILCPEDGTWPIELQDTERYTRAGCGRLDVGNIDDPDAEHKRTDFLTLRDFYLRAPGVLSDLAQCYKYWIALTDCDGFRIDTLKHVSMEDGRNFCGAIKEFAADLGKNDFLLLGEVAGGDFAQDRYLNALDRNLNAVLDIGEMKMALTGIAKGERHPRVYFDGFDAGNATMGSHRNLGARHVSVLDDHDHVFGEKIRFSSEARSEHQIVSGVAIQLFTLGIPCIYYGTEQALGGPEASVRQFLPKWKSSDRYLREAMFGPEHPRSLGATGLRPGQAGEDRNLPGFGPFGTSGYQCFDVHNPTFLRISALLTMRKQIPALRYGRQYLRPTSFLGRPFDVYGPQEILAWSRILDDEEVVCVVNTCPSEARGADVLVDADLNPSGGHMTVILNTEQAAKGDEYQGAHPARTRLKIHKAPNHSTYIEVRDVPPSEVLILTNQP